MLPIFLYTYVPVALFLCVRQRGQRGQSSLLDVCLKSRPSGLQKARALPWPFFKPPFLCTLSEGPTFFSFLSTYHDARINVCVRTSVHRKGADFFKEPYTVFRSGINLKYKKKIVFFFFSQLYTDNEGARSVCTKNNNIANVSSTLPLRGWEWDRELILSERNGDKYNILRLYLKKHTRVIYITCV